MKHGNAKLLGLIFTGFAVIGCSMITGSSNPTPIINPTVLQANNPNAQLVANLNFKIPASRGKTFYYKFAEGDTVIINALVVKGKDISEFRVEKWPNTLLYENYAIPYIKNLKLYIPSTSVLSIYLGNSSIFSEKIYRLAIYRIPTKNFEKFETSVEWIPIYDTVWVEKYETTLVKIDTISETILHTTTKIDAGKKTYVKVKLPENTSYWVYWIGVGQKALEALNSLGEKLPSGALALGITDPVTAFALGLIPQLVKLNQGLDINYYIIKDYQNLKNFLNGEGFYLIKKGERVVSDYAKMYEPKEGVVYFAFSNSYSWFTPKTVTLKVVAVKHVPKFNIKKIKVPQVSVRYKPKL